MGQNWPILPKIWGPFLWLSHLKKRVLVLRVWGISQGSFKDGMSSIMNNLPPMMSFDIVIIYLVIITNLGIKKYITIYAQHKVNNKELR